MNSVVEAAEAVLELARAEAARFDDAAAHVGLGAAEGHALRRLRGGKPLTMRDVATRLRCEPSHATALIDALERRGLAARTVADDDRRVRVVVLTPAGEAKLDVLLAVLNDAPFVVRGLSAKGRHSLRSLALRALVADMR